MQEVADHLRRRIVSGNLAYGRRLPSIAASAGLYGVSVPTMHAAIHAVEALGFLRIRHGVGVFVERPRSAAAQLNHAWMRASPAELGLLRAAIDARAPVLVARHVEELTIGRVPRTLEDLVFLASERSASRASYVETFLEADLAFHRAVASAVPGAEVLASVHEAIGKRLLPHLVTIAAVQASDRDLDGAHRDLATAVLDGQVQAALRLGRSVARREMAPGGRLG